jgi:phosphate:Na+ symporter
MAKGAAEALRGGMTALREYSPDLARSVREKEEKTDRDEDALGSYLVKLGSCPLSEEDNARIGKLLKLIGDIERIADHGVNLLESAEEMKKKEMAFTPDAMEELGRICGAVEEILELALRTFLENDEQAAVRVEPLEQDIDRLKEQLRTSHVLRLQQGRCSMEAGFIWVDVLTALERSAAHCTNIALCVMDAAHHK